ncbi:potassium/proton antiporter [Blastochloris viridis]|uniref:Na+/H+ antiporter n=1 Tax=Blastochloris viridis TaxID=1079 RepID=A0A0H5BNZ6_BLAVI|nr:potassium/proton antiporter [Blastochloris viridis]ALK08232.1 K(+)/H(+) antiporter NhaP [Blastochloris viridis]BAR98503.1 Na+/H+ antiporter [Blastochloris viridis]CUU44154.1 potassium/proton antiporter [Blastochloris viridis]
MDKLSAIDWTLFIGSGMVLAGILSSLVAKRFGAPLLLVFLAIGMLAGEDGPGGLTFGDYETTYLVGSLALSVILFDGALRTKLRLVRRALVPALVLATAGVILTAALTGAFVKFLLGGTWIEAFLVGSIVASTDAAAVMFLLRTSGLTLSPRVGATVEIESGTNDPIAVFLVILLTRLALAGETTAATVMVEVVVDFAIGAVVGVGGGLLVVRALNRLDLPPGLHSPFVATAAVAIFGFASVSGGSGLLAAYLAGLVVGNRPVKAYPAIESFQGAATWLCQIVMFLMLGLLVTPSDLVHDGLPAAAIAVFLMLVGRPLAVWLCLLPFRMPWRETAFIGWVGLRGAVSIFLAAIPTLAGLPGAEDYFNYAFVAVLVSLLVQGWTVNLAGRWSGVATPATSRPVQRMEIDMPGDTGRELVGYPVEPESPLARGGRIPPWAQAALVVRNGNVLNPRDAGDVRSGDYVYVLVAPARVNRLDALFAANVEDPTTAQIAFAELPLIGDAPLAEIAALYGLEVDGEPVATVADAFADRFADRARPGDRISLGAAVLIARRVDLDGRVALAGLRLPGFTEQPRPPGWIRLMRRLGAMPRE